MQENSIVMINLGCQVMRKMINFFDRCRFIDIHYHADPDLYQRRYGAMEVGKIYQQLNGAVVLKSHLGATSVQATLAQKEGLPVFPSLVLNKISGGINYRSVIKALSEYQASIPSKMIVHLPTITGRKHNSTLQRKMSTSYSEETLLEPEIIFNSDGKLKSAVIDILKMTRDYPIILSSGHARKDEVMSLLEACEHYHVPALLLNQPANPLTGLYFSELMTIVDQYNFVFVEQTALTYLLSYQDKSDFKNVLRDVPRVVYSSDLGQTSQMDIDCWLLNSDKWFEEFLISNNRREEICVINPSRLLALS